MSGRTYDAMIERQESDMYDMCCQHREELGIIHDPYDEEVDCADLPCHIGCPFSPNEPTDKYPEDDWRADR